MIIQKDNKIQFIGLTNIDELSSFCYSSGLILEGSYYSAFYFSIIKNAKTEKRRKGKGIYFEEHHIIPHSFGGPEVSNNLVLLTPREHFICHLLLIKITTGSYQIKMKDVVARLISGEQYKGLKIRARLYQKLKEEFSIRQSIRMKKTSIFVTNNPSKDPKRAKEMSEFQKERSIGKTYEQIFGEEVAAKLRRDRIDQWTGDNNPAKKPENRQIYSERMKGDNNPSKNPNIVKKTNESKLRNGRTKLYRLVFIDNTAQYFAGISLISKTFKISVGTLNRAIRQNKTIDKEPLIGCSIIDVTKNLENLLNESISFN